MGKVKGSKSKMKRPGMKAATLGTKRPRSSTKLSSKKRRPKGSTSPSKNDSKSLVKDSLRSSTKKTNTRRKKSRQDKNFKSDTLGFKSNKLKISLHASSDSDSELDDKEKDQQRFYDKTVEQLKKDYGEDNYFKIWTKKRDRERKIEKLKKTYQRPTNFVEDEWNKDLQGDTGKMFLKREKLYDMAVREAARTEFLLPEQTGFLEPDEGEVTSKITQTEIAEAVDISSAQKHFDLKLEQFGPYRLNYTRNGRHLLLGGAKGHIAALDWQTKKLMCELNVMEKCHDVKWLHIETMFAVAQKQWVYLYDNQGIELHCLKGFDRVLRMEFLPYHFLLCGANEVGFLRWIDTSVGKDVAGFHTNMGRLDVMCQNRTNAIVHLGHSNGVVSLWSPNVKSPLVRMLCHHQGVRSVCVDNTGNYMATSSIDRKIKIWDLRTYNELYSCKVGHGAASLSFSQTGVLAAGMCDVVQTYKNVRSSPITESYISHRCRTAVQNVQFVPYEDVLGVTHARGFTSILVPGSGEANFDALEENPFQTIKQRQQSEVKMLLEKIQPSMITVDKSLLGKVNEMTATEEFEKQKDALLLKPKKIQFRPRYRKKGANKATRVEKRKQGVIQGAKKETIKTLLERQQDKRKEMKDKQKKFCRDAAKGVLSRFIKTIDTG